ncbi:RNA polymerase sigma factor, RpoD/SigA family [Nodularia sp. NIES-3585]|uniref:RNA polymerase sigma factor, RpoD/SigA family n=1 Tax=Nodularia sp. NIES-3585 TaxID=1973477 RepID=UPI000B5C7A87|nr:RNA polymerase sigma factor, RpoD/SigA family [Nodularia sp. NIES-3585]GAX38847.1 RNA polymerase sigma factor [Nodularia sp. NIES-3585]
MSMLSSDLVHIYLKEMGRFPLLTGEEEIIYGHQVQKMISIKEIKNTLQEKLNKKLSLAELSDHIGKSESEISTIFHQGERAKQKMITANLRLVVSIAKKYQHRNVEFLDLIQEGTLGLQRGVEKFDPSRGYKLSTYAYWWITQAITRAIAQQARTIRLPINIVEKLNQIKRIQPELSQVLGRRPTLPEIAQALNLEPNQIREYLTISRQPISLDLRLSDSQDIELINIIPDENHSSDEQINFDFLRQHIQSMMESLTTTQREVLILYFGLENQQPMTLNEIAKQLNLSRERIRQIQLKAIAILRHKQQNQLEDYLVS